MPVDGHSNISCQQLKHSRAVLSCVLFILFRAAFRCMLTY